MPVLVPHRQLENSGTMGGITEVVIWSMRVEGGQEPGQGGDPGGLPVSGGTQAQSPRAIDWRVDGPGGGEKAKASRKYNRACTWVAMDYWRCPLPFSLSIKKKKKRKVTISEGSESFHENVVQCLCHNGKGETVPLAPTPAASFCSWRGVSWGCRNQEPPARGA